MPTAGGSAVIASVTAVPESQLAPKGWRTAVSTGCPPPCPKPALRTRSIDEFWIEQDGDVAAAFEVEHTTSIYSDIVRVLIWLWASTVPQRATSSSSLRTTESEVQSPAPVLARRRIRPA